MSFPPPFQILEIPSVVPFERRRGWSEKLLFDRSRQVHEDLSIKRIDGRGQVLQITGEHSSDSDKKNGDESSSFSRSFSVDTCPREGSRGRLPACKIARGQEPLNSKRVSRKVTSTYIP